jgi:hypothetical protein
VSAWSAFVARTWARFPRLELAPRAERSPRLSRAPRSRWLPLVAGCAALLALVLWSIGARLIAEHSTRSPAVIPHEVELVAPRR